MATSAEKFVKQFDFLGVRPPQMNIRGETKIKTYFGSVSSVIIGILTCTFALIKLEHLFSRKNPSLSQNLEINSSGAVYDIANEDFMMAFAMSDWQTGPKNDTRYFQWALQVSTSFANEGGVKFYPMHRCTDQEFAKFNQFESSSVSKATNLHEERLLWCMDPAHMVQLKGSWQRD